MDDPSTISISQFSAVDMRVGRIVSADTMDGSEKLLNLTIAIGTPEPRTILSGIRAYYKPEDLVGKKCVVVVNLHPRTMMGLESNGMVVCVSHQGVGSDENSIQEKVQIVEPPADAPLGSRLS